MRVARAMPSFQSVQIIKHVLLIACILTPDVLQSSTDGTTNLNQSCLSCGVACVLLTMCRVLVYLGFHKDSTAAGSGELSAKTAPKLDLPCLREYLPGLHQQHGWKKSNGGQEMKV